MDNIQQLVEEPIASTSSAFNANIESQDNGIVEEFNNENNPVSEIITARQHTLLWNEDMCLNIAPGQKNVPLNIIYNRYAEELSFPAIYYGHSRKCNNNLSITPYIRATSEIRRSDRRGVTPQHILYMAMMILRLRVIQGIQSTFKQVKENENITRKMLEDKR